MADLRDEVADLTADLLAVLEDRSLRGVRTETVGALEPATLTPTPPTPTPPTPTKPKTPVEASAWSAIAVRDRSAAEAPRFGAEGMRLVREEIGDCRRCPRCTQRRNIVFGVGDPQADLMVIGEGPGAQDDARGEPFVGPAGQMLDKMLENVLRLTRSEVYIANVVKCRPPRNRSPEPGEIAMCRPFLERQVAAVQPKVILVLGAVALSALFDRQGIKQHRGKWFEYQQIPALTTFHPAYLLRQPQDKRPVFEDLKALNQRYDAQGGRRAR